MTKKSDSGKYMHHLGTESVHSQISQKNSPYLIVELISPQTFDLDLFHRFPKTFIAELTNRHIQEEDIAEILVHGFCDNYAALIEVNSPCERSYQLKFRSKKEQFHRKITTEVREGISDFKNSMHNIASLLRSHIIHSGVPGMVLGTTPNLACKLEDHMAAFRYEGENSTHTLFNRYNIIK